MTGKKPAGTRETTGYSWDDVNRLAGFSTAATSNVAYKYLADEMRVAKSTVAVGRAVTQTQVTFCDGQMPAETVDFGTTNTVTRNFVGARGIEAIFTTTSTSDTTSYPLYDAHSNMTSNLSKAGNSYVNGNVRTYDVWGGIRSGAQTAGPNNRSCASLGHVQDDESGLIYMRARYYEPGSGRFLNEDGRRQGSNYDTYVENMPTSKVDRTGNGPEEEGYFGPLDELIFGIAVLGVLVYRGREFLEEFKSGNGLNGSRLTAIDLLGDEACNEYAPKW